MQLKILSWNIWINGHFDQIVDFLKTSNADIIALQEVKDNDPSRDVISYLGGLGYQYAFASNKHSWNGKTYAHGPAIFSKHGIHATRTYTLSGKDPRVAVRADIPVGDKILHIFNTHFVHTHQEPSKEQEEQARYLLITLPKERVIVVGDFNATPESTTIKIMREALVDADSASMPTWSVYPEGCRTCSPRGIDTRLDYIFTSHDIAVDSFRVEDSKGSDHLPISATIKI